jgi:hypothetical protein
MKIQQKDLYHGAALTQIAEHPSFKALNKADAKYGHYLVNDNRRLLVKPTTEEEPTWQFTFQTNDLDTLRADVAGGFETFVVLICGTKTICLLSAEDLPSLIDLDAVKSQSIYVEIPKASMRVRGTAGQLKHAVTHNAFPDGIFA